MFEWLKNNLRRWREIAWMEIRYFWLVWVGVSFMALFDWSPWGVALGVTLVIGGLVWGAVCVMALTAMGQNWKEWP